MSTITGYDASAYGATASMLRSTTSAGAAPIGNASSQARSSSPKDTAELSDYARTMLARARTERAAANKLAALVAEVILNGKDNAASKTSVKLEKDDGTTLFKALIGHSDSPKASNDASPPQNLSDIDPVDRVKFSEALIAANRQSDGTIKSFTHEVHDVIAAPSTPAEIDEWFETNGQSYIEGARQVNDPEYNIMAQAIQNRTLKVQNAMDIPGLNFHNTIIFETGAVGASVNGSFAYNRDADIFKDPMMNYIVNSDGTVLSWKKDPNT